MDGHAVRAEQLVRLLSARRAAIAAAVLAAALPGCSGSSDGPAPPKRPQALAAVARAEVPDPALHDATALARSMSRPPARLRFFRSTRHRALGAMAPDAPTLGRDEPVYVATFAGRLSYARARTLPGESKTVRGRFAYSTYDRRGDSLDLGVLPRPPRSLR